MNIFKINKMINFILILLVIYAIITFTNQIKKLNSYNKEISYYSTQIENLKKEQEELISTQENVNSEEYIEKVAREKLEMYLPNEIVFVDINK